MSTTAKPIMVLCPNLRCRTVLTVPADVRGQKVRCGQCGMSFLVPATPPKGEHVSTPGGQTP